MLRKIAAALVAATVLTAPVLVAEAAAATPPETVTPGKAKTSKAKTSKAETSKAKITGNSARKPMTLAAIGSKNQVTATKKSKQQAKVLRAKPKQAKSKATAEYTGSVAPRSVPTPGLY